MMDAVLITGETQRRGRVETEAETGGRWLPAQGRPGIWKKSISSREREKPGMDTPLGLTERTCLPEAWISVVSDTESWKADSPRWCRLR